MALGRPPYHCVGSNQAGPEPLKSSPVQLMPAPGGNQIRGAAGSKRWVGSCPGFPAPCYPKSRPARGSGSTSWRTFACSGPAFLPGGAGERDGAEMKQGCEVTRSRRPQRHDIETAEAGGVVGVDIQRRDLVRTFPRPRAARWAVSTPTTRLPLRTKARPGYPFETANARTRPPDPTA